MDLNRYTLGSAASDFSTIAVLVPVVVGLAAVILALAHAVGPKRVGAVKHDTYESGMDPVGDTRRRFNVRFYLVAVLFLVFDVELVFLYPWAVLAPRLRAAADASLKAWTPEQVGWAQALTGAGYTPMFLLAAVSVFFALLLVGLVYEWRRGVFQWN